MMTVKKSDVLFETMLNLLELLKIVLSVRLADEDQEALQGKLHGIADNTISKIREEHERGAFVGMTTAYHSLR